MMTCMCCAQELSQKELKGRVSWDASMIWTDEMVAGMCWGVAGVEGRLIQASCPGAAT
jgi:hypothetical protein